MSSVSQDREISTVSGFSRYLWYGDGMRGGVGYNGYVPMVCTPSLPPVFSADVVFAVTRLPDGGDVTRPMKPRRRPFRLGS